MHTLSRILTLRLMALALSFLTPLLGHASDVETIRFQMSTPDYPPYLIYEVNQPPKGIMYDVLNRIATEEGYKIEPTQVPRKRVDYMMSKRSLDATPRAIEWTKKPQDFIFTDAVVPVRDIIVTPVHNETNITRREDLNGMRLGAHIGYRYPSVEQQIKNQQIRRFDAYNEYAMFGLLQSMRVDGLLMNELVAKWLIRKYKWSDQFKISKLVVDSVDYRFMFTKDWDQFVVTFNQKLKLMRESGELDKIIERYQ